MVKQKAVTTITHYYVQSLSDYAVVGPRRLILKTIRGCLKSTQVTWLCQVKSSHFDLLKSTWGHF